LQRIGIQGIDASYEIVGSTLLPKTAELVEHSFDSIKELNKMCEAISALDHGNRWKLDAVVDMAQPENEVEQEFRMGGF
jgi:flagellar biosynthesis regulator FlaF